MLRGFLECCGVPWDAAGLEGVPREPPPRPPSIQRTDCAPLPQPTNQLTDRPPGANWAAVEAYVDISEALKEFEMSPEPGKDGAAGAGDAAAAAGGGTAGGSVGISGGGMGAVADGSVGVGAGPAAPAKASPRSLEVVGGGKEGAGPWPSAGALDGYATDTGRDRWEVLLLPFTGTRAFQPDHRQWLREPASLRCYP